MGKQNNTETNARTEEKLTESSNKQSSAAKNRRNRRNKSDKTSAVQGKFKPTNTASMYFNDLSLADQTTRFSFNQFLGDAKTLEVFGACPPSTVLSLAINPSPGLTTGADDAGINIAGRRTYTRLSAGNAKTTNYAPQDVTTLILAIGEIISMIEVAKRAFRVVYTYDVRNKSVPRGIIRAMGFDPEMLDEGKIGPLRIDLNVAINSFNQIPIMKNISYFAKCAEVYANYYSDSESRMSQYYLFSPYSTWILDETGSEQGSVLRTENVLLGTTSSMQKMGDFIATIKRMIRAISDSSTFGYIYADILRLVPDADQYKVALLMENEILLPVYDPMKLLQIHNSTSTGFPDGDVYNKEVVTPRNDVYPNVENNSIEYLPSFFTTNKTAYPQANQELVVDFPHSMGDPDLDQRVDITRYQSVITVKEPGTATDLQHSTLPDHYVVGYHTFFNGDVRAAFGSRIVYRSPEPNPKISKVLEIVADLQKFDYHPFIRCEYTNPNDETDVTNVLFGDIDFFTTIDVEYLDRMNDLCYQGLMEFRS